MAGALEDHEVSPDVQQTIDSFLALSPAGREDFFDAVEELVPSPSDNELDPEVLREINRRSDEIDAGTAVMRPWAEVRAELRQRHGLND